MGYSSVGVCRRRQHYRYVGSSEVVPPTPRFAQAVRRELSELQKTITRSDVASQINQESRSPRLSVGSEESMGKGILPETATTLQSELIAPPSIAPSEFDFDTLTKGRRTPPLMTPRVVPVQTTVRPIIGCAAAQMFGGSNRLPLHNVRPASNVDELSGVE